jgi:hypothetical protein
LRAQYAASRRTREAALAEELAARAAAEAKVVEAELAATQKACAFRLLSYVLLNTARATCCAMSPIYNQLVLFNAFTAGCMRSQCMYISVYTV